MTGAGPVLVTGATGFVGSGIVRAFLATGYPVRALVRAASPLANLAGLEVESACADICDRVPRMIGRDALTAVVVIPSTPVRPRDVRQTPTGRIIVEAASGHMPGFLDVGLNLVHVDDVAAGHVAALERGRIGERYILGGDNVLLADMLRDIALLVGRRPPRLKLPRGPLYPLAAAAQMIAAVSGREPLL